MHISNVALLLLAASATAPVLAAPLHHSNARPDDDVASLKNHALSEDISSSSMLRSREQHIQSRAVLASILARLLKLIGFRIHLRDVTPGELARRDDPDGFIDTYFMNPRNLGAQPDIQTRSTLDSVEAVARDGSMDDFINALLKTRDSSNMIRENLLSLASLAGRELDDLE